MRQLSSDDYSSEFGENYEYYRQWIERGLVKQVYDRGRFDDLCQDTFVKALKSLASQDAVKLPQTDYHLGNLLCIMAVQVAIDDSRKNKKSKDNLYLSESEAFAQSTGLLIEGHENWICDRDRLQRVLAQMPLRYQQCVLLKDRGYKQYEIAEKLDINKSTVSEILSNVKTQLQRKYFPVSVELRCEETLYVLVEKLSVLDAAKESGSLLIPSSCGQERSLERWEKVSEAVRVRDAHRRYITINDMYSALYLGSDFPQEQLDCEDTITLITPRGEPFCYLPAG